jgi:hypothetical protein
MGGGPACKAFISCTEPKLRFRITLLVRSSQPHISLAMVTIPTHVHHAYSLLGGCISLFGRPKQPFGGNGRVLGSCPPAERIALMRLFYRNAPRVLAGGLLADAKG